MAYVPAMELYRVQLDFYKQLAMIRYASCETEYRCLYCRSSHTKETCPNCGAMEKEVSG